MKKITVALFTSVFLLAMPACNNSPNNPVTEKKEKTPADILVEAVEEGHNFGMARMGQLTRAQQEAKRIRDSIAKLPVKAQQSAAPYRARLEDLLQDLDHANAAMDKWMEEYKWDSAFTSDKGKISYLQVEKEKVNAVKEAILSSLQKADSVLQKKH